MPRPVGATGRHPCCPALPTSARQELIRSCWRGQQHPPEAAGGAALLRAGWRLHFPALEAYTGPLRRCPLPAPPPGARTCTVSEKTGRQGDKVHACSRGAGHVAAAVSTATAVPSSAGSVIPSQSWPRYIKEKTREVNDSPVSECVPFSVA